jgi:hypothetical protein
MAHGIHNTRRPGTGARGIVITAVTAPDAHGAGSPGSSAHGRRLNGGTIKTSPPAPD